MGRGVGILESVEYVCTTDMCIRSWLFCTEMHTSPVCCLLWKSFNCLKSKHQSCLLSAVNCISTVKIQNTRPIYCLLCAVFPPLKFKTPALFFFFSWVQSFHKLNSKHQDCLLCAVFPQVKLKSTMIICCLLCAVFLPLELKASWRHCRFYSAAN